MFETERKAFELLNNYATNYKSESLLKIIKKIKNVTIKIRQKEVNKAFDRAFLLSADLPLQTHNDISGILRYNYPSFIKNPQENKNRMYKAIQKILDKDGITSINANDYKNLFSNLPDYRNDAGEFIVKNEKNILESLFFNAQATANRAVPQKFNGTNQNKYPSYYNFLLTTKKGSYIKADNTLANIIKGFEGEFQTFFQRDYIDPIIEFINNGGMEGYEYYPYAFKNHLLKETNGKVRLDISKMHIDEETAAKISLIPLNF